MVRAINLGIHILPVISQPRLLSFSLDGWTVLGGEVGLNLTDSVSVLVGRNGAGKSAILEGLNAIAAFACGRRKIRQVDYESIPKILSISVLTPTNRYLDYRYEFIPPFSPDDDDVDIDEAYVNNSEEGLISWNDRCQYADGNKEIIWTTELGETTLYYEGNESDTVVLGNTTPFGRIGRNLSVNFKKKLPDEMEWIFDVLKGVRILGKGPIRQTSKRRLSLIGVSRSSIHPRISYGHGPLDFLARRILRRIEAGELQELENICQRIGLGEKITVKKFILSSESRKNNDKEDDEYVSSVLLDETNIGLLSDGTLRVLSILIEIMTTSPSATIIIEEPELQIHPGMLSKLLAEIETYTFEDNLILSTHSPQVVSWTDPGKINLVYRSDGKTFVRNLGDDEIERVVEYLCEEGSLGDWIYGGLLDD